MASMATAGSEPQTTHLGPRRRRRPQRRPLFEAAAFVTLALGFAFAYGGLFHLSDQGGLPSWLRGSAVGTFSQTVLRTFGPLLAAVRRRPEPPPACWSPPGLSRAAQPALANTRSTSSSDRAAVPSSSCESSSPAKLSRR
jgi:hypothetical protein